MRIQMKAIVPDKLFDEKKIRDEIKKTLKEVTGKKLQKDFKATVKTWDNKPRFPSKIRSRKDSIAVIVYPTGPNKDQYYYVHEGTKPRKIVPRKPGGLLWFQPGYTPATRRRVIGSGQAMRSGPFVPAKMIRRHSIEPREFSTAIAKKQKKPFRQDIQRAISRAVD